MFEALTARDNKPNRDHEPDDCEQDDGANDLIAGERMTPTYVGKLAQVTTDGVTGRRARRWFSVKQSCDTNMANFFDCERRRSRV